MNQKIHGILSVKDFSNFPLSEKYRYIFKELKNYGLEHEGLYFCKIFVNSIVAENAEITENEIADFFCESRKIIKRINFSKNKKRDFSYYFTNWFLWNYSATEQEEHRKNIEAFMKDDKSYRRFVSY